MKIKKRSKASKRQLLGVQQATQALLHACINELADDEPQAAAARELVSEIARFDSERLEGLQKLLQDYRTAMSSSFSIPEFSANFCEHEGGWGALYKVACRRAIWEYLEPDDPHEQYPEWLLTIALQRFYAEWSDDGWLDLVGGYLH